MVNGDLSKRSFNTSEVKKKARERSEELEGMRIKLAEKEKGNKRLCGKHCKFIKLRRGNTLFSQCILYLQNAEFIY